MEDGKEIRRTISNQFSMRGLSLSKDALTYLADQLKVLEKNQSHKTMSKVMMLVEKHNVPKGILNLDILKEMLKVLQRQRKNESETHFKLENAIEWHENLVDNNKHQTLSSGASPWQQLSPHAYWQRFELIKKLIAGSLDNFMSVDSLLTQCGSNVRVLAQLCRGEGRNFIAEDLTGKVRLNLSVAQYEPGIYFEGGIFVFEGVYSSTDENLQVERVELPKLKSIDMAQGMVNIRENRLKDPNDRIAFFSDVLLDNDNVMRALYHILERFSINPPNVFVLCGRFLSVQQAHGYIEQSTRAFRHLANIISQFGSSYMKTNFVLVPSLEDPPSLVTLPRPTFLPNVQKCFKDLPNVHFATNPCRLIFKDQKILIYRDDLVEKFCRSAIHTQSVKAETIPSLFTDTIWSQHHLSPLPLFYSPVRPNFDVLFQLWPAPDVLVLADKFKTFEEQAGENKRLTINPGPFSSGSDFKFQLLFPTLGRIENTIYELER